MKLALRGWKADRRAFWTLLCVGMLAGIILMNLGKSILLENTGLLDENTLYRMKNMTVDGSALFWYVFRKRLGSTLVLMVLSTTYLGLVVCMGAALWYGTSAGAFLAALIIRYGLKGILLAFVSILPQYLIYIPAALTLFSWCSALFRGIYARSGDFDLSDKGALLKKAGQLLGILAALTVGCLLEGYVNPYLLLGFLKIF